VCDAHDPQLVIARQGKKKEKSSFFSKLVSSVKGHKTVDEARLVSSPPVETPSLHASCKTWCDEYFFLPARLEHRGVGGVFFDDVVDHNRVDNESGVDGSNAKSDDDGSDAKSDDSKSDKNKSNDDSNERVKPTNAARFTKAIGENWLLSYEPVVKKRWETQYTAAHEKWHHQRRGRYVEFNLLYDRGVRFGLDGGRVESIMVSAPPRVRWVSISNNHIPPTDCPYETDIYFYNLRTIASIRRRGRRRRGWCRF
jgi:coproporphyrinogen III oxidase